VPPAKRSAIRKAPATNAAKPGGASKNGGAAAVTKFVAQQPPDKRELLEKLRVLVVKGLPDATPSIKWGVPVYQQNGKNVVALAVFKEYVGINFFASPDVLVDPGKKLEGGGKTQRMLKVRTSKDIDSASILRWLKAAASD
jgi:hypothetical protein